MDRVGPGGFAISLLLQEMMVYVGQMESYGNGVEVLEKLAGLKVIGTQLYRVTVRGAFGHPNSTEGTRFKSRAGEPLLRLEKEQQAQQEMLNV